MKRNHHDDDQLQYIVRALDNADAILRFSIEQLDAMLYAFRFHPGRLLRLMQTSHSMKDVVEQTLLYNPRFWYDSCVAAFPGIIVILDVDHRFEDLNRLTERMLKELPPGIQNPFLSHPGMYNSPWHFYPSKKECKQQTGALELFDLKACHSFAAANDVDSDFLEHSRWQERYDARQMENHFAFFFPYALPPVEYCFVSRVKTQAFFMEFISLLPKDVAERYVIYGNQSESYEWYWEQHRHNELKNIDTSLYWRYFERNRYDKEVFSLSTLAKEIVLIMNNDEEEVFFKDMTKAISLLKRVHRVQLLHATPEEYERLIVTIGETDGDLNGERALLFALYDTYDPLYWDVLLREKRNINGEDLFEAYGAGKYRKAMDWKKVILTQLEWVDQYGNKEMRKRIASYFK